VGLDGYHLYLNSHYLSKYKTVKGDYSKLHSKDLIHPEDFPKTQETAQKCLENIHDTIYIEFRIKTDNEYYAKSYWEISAFVINEEVQGIFCLGYDVKDLRAYIKDIKQKNELLTKIAWQQSHLVRGPIATIQGLSKLLMENDYTEEEKELFINLIYEQTQKLDTVVHQVVELTDIVEPIKS
jgi:signal transduction histidine kinase